MTSWDPVAVSPAACHVSSMRYSARGTMTCRTIGVPPGSPGLLASVSTTHAPQK